MRCLTFATAILVSCGALVIPASDARACGGCFHNETTATTQPSVVTAHRMALSVSPTRTVLWDQVQYAGDPTDFAWVLPVGAGAYVEQAHDAWFEALDAVTGTRVVSQALVCNGQTYREGGSVGCGASPGVAAEDKSAGPDTPQVEGDSNGVTVVHEGTVGPYETVTLSSTSGTSLRDWLLSHGYVIPTDIDPIIDAYVAAGAEFIALRLQPGAGVRQMTPVRVVTPGASPILPLRMVAAGTGPSVSIVLYVLAEGRYATQNFNAATLPYDELTWDWSQLQSNYSQLRDAALADNGWLTSFALPQGLQAAIATPDGTLAQYQVGTTGQTANDLADLYFAQAAADDFVPTSCPTISPELTVSGEVVERCSVTGCGDTIPETTYACGSWTDIATALVGMHPGDVWVTRLEANLQRSALAKDLVLKAADDQRTVPNWYVAPKNIAAPCDPNAPSATSSGSSDSGACTTGRSPRRSRWSNGMLAGLVAAAVFGAVRRLRRRGSRSSAR